LSTVDDIQSHHARPLFFVLRAISVDLIYIVNIKSNKKER